MTAGEDQGDDEGDGDDYGYVQKSWEPASLEISDPGDTYT
jgi:hypothetical protein